MTRVAFRGLAREHLIALAIALVVAALCLLVSSGPAHGADGSASLKPYSPFDEPKPALPQEMAADKRLDQRVKVCSRSNSLRGLLDELTRVTGVRLSAEPRLAAEHPLIFFRATTLRNLMSELSGFYGYTWYAKPDRGGYRYDLMEDAAHIKARSARMRENKHQADAQMIEFVEAYLAISPDEERIKQLQYTNNSVFQSLYGPTSAYTRQILAGIGLDTLARALSGNVTMNFSEAPADLQSSVCAYMNAVAEMGRRWRGGDDAPPSAAVAPESMAAGTIRIGRAETGSSNSTRFEITVTSPTGNVSTIQWPNRSLRYDDMAAVAGWGMAQTASDARSLPSDMRISPPIPKARLWLTLADIMQAVAEQSGRDVIADSIRQEQQQPLISGVPIGALIERLCNEQGYACQIDDSIIRFRQKQWYAQTPAEEPPSGLIASCWKNLEKAGKLSSADLVAIASLPPKQREWPGFREMSGASSVLRWPDAFRLYVSLIDTKVGAEGLAVSKLSPDQRKLLDAWLAVGVAVDPAELARAAVVITTEQSTGGYGSRSSTPAEYQQISIKSGDKVLFGTPIFLPNALSDDDRKTLIAMRKADREGEVVKLLK